MTPKKRGPKPILGTTLRRYLVTLDHETVRVARSLGNRNLSKGIREAVRLTPRRAGPFDQEGD